MRDLLVVRSPPAWDKIDGRRSRIRLATSSPSSTEAKTANTSVTFCSVGAVLGTW